ncbi:Cation channel sperm-associated protein 1 [Blastocladiella emersonii ATCC 22665]|nr:Cation channel sperm-associated protein 1 [Blastocladiella emersonii ATCC 22665]
MVESPRWTPSSRRVSASTSPSSRRASASPSLSASASLSSSSYLDDFGSSSAGRASNMGDQASITLGETIDPGSYRAALHRLVTHKLFSSTILALILSNTVLMALQTTGVNVNYGWYFDLIDMCFLGVYLMETGIKLYVFRLLYFKSGWNSFDFTIVAVSILSFLMPYIAQASAGFNTQILRLLRIFRAFRALRSLRVLRTISMFRSLQILVETILRSIPALGSIVCLMALILYIFAVVARSLYSGVDQHRFGSMGTTLFRLFSVLTFDDWSSLYIDSRDKDATIYFFMFAFVVLEGFILLNLFVAVIVSNLSNGHMRDRAKTARALKPVEQPVTATASVENLVDKTKANDEERALLALFETHSATTSVEWLYPPTLSAKRRELIGRYFALLALLEHNWRATARQGQVLDDLVDLTKGSRSKP